ncbi:LysM peptidoglycan-binding domain-containing protein [Arthrobacter echini]|uniref:LysM peptidoglycan-binding domain-containing protein n=1 Tax=Arthrobacter echini TaxID=1529066 RepID=A0A4S5E0M9_9MICC|nr:LysM peptidoglycan-binding domain-containing protein [Arthrobacter echini]THJ64840.1 LysM peptidoglycan-binding domain-containing protein [Arthrobacter echini]
MSDQRPNVQQHTVRRKDLDGGPRLLDVAVTAAALPAVVLSSVALAGPASAAPPQHAPITQLTGSPVGQLKAGRIVPADLVAVQVPSQAISVTASVPARHAGMTTGMTTDGHHTVRQGETITAIAEQHGLSTEAVLTLNRMDAGTIIRPGQKITVSASPSPGSVGPAPAGTYTVAAGDTLTAIAARNQVPLGPLLSVNELSMTSLIHPGQELVLPGGDAARGPAAEPVSAAPAPVDPVPATFLGHTYPEQVVSDANASKAALESLPVPSRDEMQQIVTDTARSMGVEPSLALAFSFQESGFDQRAVSPANAIGAMQVIPSSGAWASELVGRPLDLLDPRDNATAGVAIIRSLIRTSDSLDLAIASYYQGQSSVTARGMFDDTKQYVAAVKAHQENFR